MSMSLEDMAVALGRIDTTVSEVRDDVKDIRAQTIRTNGRVTALEALRIADEAVRAERARVIEDSRAHRAEHLSARAWVPPAIINSTIFVAGIIVAHFLHLVPHA